MKNVRHQDLLDALDHMSDFEEQPLHLDDFQVTAPSMTTVDDLHGYDDLSAWLEWDDGELREYDEDERRDVVAGFRGEEWARRAMAWRRPEDVPPIVVVEGPTYTAIADGRGRVSYAVGMGWHRVPTVIATHAEVLE